jgi:hypothetical protein
VPCWGDPSRIASIPPKLTTCVISRFLPLSRAIACASSLTFLACPGSPTARERTEAKERRHGYGVVAGIASEGKTFLEEFLAPSVVTRLPRQLPQAIQRNTQARAPTLERLARLP